MREVPPALAILRSIFDDRKGRNHSYSLRAFARDIGVSPGYLSLVLLGRKPVNLKLAIQIAERIPLDTTKKSAFLASASSQLRQKISEKQVRQSSKKLSDTIPLNDTQFHMVSHWYYAAILDLTHLEGFQSKFSWVASQLGISVQEVKEAVTGLEKIGLLEIKDGQWIKTHKHIEYHSNVPNESLRRLHQEMLHLGYLEIGQGSETRVQLRSFLGSTVPVNTARIPEAKRRLQKFHTELMTFLSEGETTELYMLANQLFPLTKVQEAN